MSPNDNELRVYSSAESLMKCGLKRLFSSTIDTLYFKGWKSSERGYTLSGRWKFR